MHLVVTIFLNSWERNVCIYWISTKYCTQTELITHTYEQIGWEKHRNMERIGKSKRVKETPKRRVRVATNWKVLQTIERCTSNEIRNVKSLNVCWKHIHTLCHECQLCSSVEFLFSIVSTFSKRHSDMGYQAIKVADGR